MIVITIIGWIFAVISSILITYGILFAVIRHFSDTEMLEKRISDLYDKVHKLEKPEKLTDITSRGKIIK